MRRLPGWTERREDTEDRVESGGAGPSRGFCAPNRRSVRGEWVCRCGTPETMAGLLDAGGCQGVVTVKLGASPSVVAAALLWGYGGTD